MYTRKMEALTCFFVFNPTLGNDEDDSDRILYFFPSKNIDINTQCGYVGLVSGLVNFSKDFSSTPCQSLQTERNRYAFVEVEKDIWMALALKNPRKDSKHDKHRNKSSAVSNMHDGNDSGAASGINSDNLSSMDSHIDSNDNDKIEIPKSDLCETDHLPIINSKIFMESEFRDSVLLTILKSAYWTFVFFHGTIDHIIITQGYDALRKKLRLFFEYYLPTVQFHQLRYFSDLFGFRFFAVDRTTYLTLQYLNNSVMSEYPQLHSLSVMYNGKLIWSGISQEDMRVLYAANQDPFSAYIYTFMARHQAIVTRESENEKNKNTVTKQQLRQELDKNESKKNKKKKQYYRHTATAAQETNYQKSKPKFNSETTIAQEIGQEIKDFRQSMSGEFVTGPLSQEYYSEETPIVYIAGYKRFYRMICYKLRKLYLFWLMDDNSLQQPMFDDAFDSILNSLDLGDENLTQKLEEKENEHQSTNASSSSQIIKSESPSFGPLADDVTAKYFTNATKNNKNDSNDNGQMQDFEGIADAIKSSSHGIGIGKHHLSRALQERIKFYQKLQTFIEPQCEEISKELERHEKRQNSRKSKGQGGQSQNFRFLYFNHQNLALKAVLKAPGKKLSTDTCRTLRNIRSDFKRAGMAITDVCAKCADGWVVARKSHFGGRELYLLVDDSEASTLTDLQDHMDALEEEYFSNIFML